MIGCRPPQGTPDGTLCWVQGPKGQKQTMRWDNAWGGMWFVPWTSISPRAQGLEGWRFHSVATEPDDIA